MFMRTLSSTKYPWLLFIIVVVGLFSRWLSWPGFATHDTLFVTREAIAGQYTTYHPILNALLVRIFAVPFESYWLYTSLQIVFCCALFYRSLLHVFGNSRGYLLPLISTVIWAFSLPTALYLGMVWKDVPLAYSILFVGSLIYRVRREVDYKLALVDASLLGFSVFLVLGMRHGMIFNLLLIPVLFGLQRFCKDRRIWIPFAFAFVGFIGLQALSSSSIVRNDESHMLKLKISASAQPFLAIVSNKNGYASDDYGYDERLARRAFGPDYASDFTPDYFRNEIALNGESELESVYTAILKRTPRLCATNFAQCISARIQMLLSTLQPSTSYGGMLFYDLGALDSCETVFGMSLDQCVVLSEYEASEKLGSAVLLQKKLQSHFVESRSAFVKLVVWNLLPAIALLLLIIVFARSFSPIWMIAVFFGVQLVLPFLTSMANDFRYYYFLFLFAVLFGPAAFGELMSRVSGVRLKRFAGL